MSYNFSDAPTQQGRDFPLLPEGTFAYVIISLKATDDGKVIHTGANGQAQMLKLDMTICSGEHAKKRVFDQIGWNHADKGEKGANYKNMGRAAIRAILEVGRNAFKDPAGYAITDPRDLHGLVAAVKIGVKAASTDPKTGREYKAGNVIKCFLSPNPDSDGYKDYLKLVAALGEPPANSIAVRPSTPGMGFTPADSAGNPLTSQEDYPWES